MPKKRKIRKQKMQVPMKIPVMQTTVSPVSFQETQSIKIPEKFSLKNTSGQYPAMNNAHIYLNAELRKTALLSASIILGEIVLFLLVRNHLIVLLNLPY